MQSYFSLFLVLVTRGFLWVIYPCVQQCYSYRHIMLAVEGLMQGQAPLLEERLHYGDTFILEVKTQSAVE